MPYEINKMYILARDLNKNGNGDERDIKKLKKRYGHIKVVKSKDKTKMVRDIVGLNTEVFNVKWVNTSYEQ
jgi:hypothetical protein